MAVEIDRRTTYKWQLPPDVSASFDDDYNIVIEVPQVKDQDFQSAVKDLSKAVS